MIKVVDLLDGILAGLTFLTCVVVTPYLLTLERAFLVPIVADALLVLVVFYARIYFTEGPND